MHMNNLKKTYDRADIEYEDRQISYFIISYYLVHTLNLTIKYIFPIPVDLYSQVSIILGIILVVFFLKSIRIVLKRSLIPFVFCEFFLLSLFLLSYLMGNAELSLLLENAVWAMIICLPLGIYMYSISNKGIFYKLFIKSSLIMSILLFLSIVFNEKDISYSMPFSYALLVPTLFHINEFFERGRKIYLCISLIEIISIILFGSRGALISIAFFLILKFILNEKNLIKKISVIFIILITLIIIYFNFDRLGMVILEYLAEKGYYSRTLYLLFSNRITYDSGRFEIFKYYLNLVKQKPFLGWGVLGGWIKKGSGPHNMLIEVLLAFGVIVGGLINLLLLLSQFRIFFVKDKKTRDLLAIYMSICIVLFFVSGNVLQKPNLFIFLVLVLSSFNHRKRKIDIGGVKYDYTTEK